MLAAALVGHAHLEEELLFTTLEPHIGPMGPLSVMRMEQGQIEAALAHLPKIQDLAEAQSLLLHAIQVAREHFAKEEQLLYPIAEQALDTDTLTQLGRLWADRRGVVISRKSGGEP